MNDFTERGSGVGGVCIFDTTGDCYQDPLLFTISTGTSVAPISPHYHSLIDWKSCLCTILLANRDQYSGAGSSIREKDQHEYVFEPAWWNRKQYIDRFWGKVKPSIKRKDHALNGPGKHLPRATRRRKVLHVFGSYQQQHMDSHTTVTL